VQLVSCAIGPGFATICHGFISTSPECGIVMFSYEAAVVASNGEERGVCHEHEIFEVGLDDWIDGP
jgi:ABC-type uncharacterized transport system permease subunit